MVAPSAAVSPHAILDENAPHAYTLPAEDALRLHEARNLSLGAENALLLAERRLRELLEREAAIMREIAATHGLAEDSSWTLDGRTLRPLAK